MFYKAAIEMFEMLTDPTEQDMDPMQAAYKVCQHFYMTDDQHEIFLDIIAEL